MSLSHGLTLTGAAEFCWSWMGWRPERAVVWVGAGGGTEVSPWARMSSVDRGNGGPSCGAWEGGVGGTRGGCAWPWERRARGRLGGPWGVGVNGGARVWGVEEDEE